MDLERELSELFERRAAAVPVLPADLGAVRGRARSIRRRRMAATGVGVAVAVAVIAVPFAMLRGVEGAREGLPIAPPPSSESTTATNPDDGCSSDGVPMPARPTDLPAPVLDTWQRLVDAAAACDFDALEQMGATARTSSDGGSADNLRRWEAEGRGETGTLLSLLGLSHAPLTQGEPGSFAWPAAYTRGTWDNVPQAERDELRAIHSAEEMAGFGAPNGVTDGYFGWRLGIGPDGTWQFFTEGD